MEIEHGKVLIVQLLAAGRLNSKGEREVFFELNGQMRSMYVLDSEASKDIVVRPRAIAGSRGSIGAPMPGEILELKVKVGDIGRLLIRFDPSPQQQQKHLFVCFLVVPKTTLFVLSAMKMEMNIDTPIGGTVKRVCLQKGDKAAAGDLVVEIE